MTKLRWPGDAESATSSAPEPSPSEPDARPGWPITLTPISVWITDGLLASCRRSGHCPSFGEPPCAWRWTASLWEAIITGYSRPGDRVRVSDAGDGTVVDVALAQGRQLTAPDHHRLPRTASNGSCWAPSPATPAALRWLLTRGCRTRRETSTIC
jgi:hypothetical protein